MERRLAAVLYADVAGYSRLTGADEEGTHRKLNAGLDLLTAGIEAAGGRAVHEAGDAILAEFPSVVAAVTCALDFQDEMQSRNADLAEDERLQFRVGVNLGDVIHDRDDIYGDGVNIAARLEALAEPGGICVSANVFEQVRERVDTAFVDLGPQKMKNIAQPVHAFSVKPGTQADTTRSVSTEAEKPAIAVLPFQNLIGDTDQEFFADGVAEDIISALSRNRWLVVIARNSSFSFKGQSIDLKQVGAQLGVRYVLDGSIRKAGDRIRVTAQLVDSGSGNQLWSERYDRVLEDIFAVQDEITAAIVAAIAPELGKAEQQRASTRTAGQLGAWEVYQRGMWHLYRRTRDDLAEARRLLGRALELDGTLCAAAAGLVDAYYYEIVLGHAESFEENRRLALATARRAIELDPDDGAAHCAMGKARICRREHALAEPDLQLAIELNPSLAWAHYGLGAAAVFSGRGETAIEHLHHAIRLSPRDQHMGSFMVRLAEAYMISRDYDEAIAWGRKSLQQQGFQWSRYAVLIAALGHLGRPEEAQSVLAECLEQRPDFSIDMVRNGHLYTDPQAFEFYLQGLREAGVAET